MVQHGNLKLCWKADVSYRYGLQLFPLRSEVRVLGTDRFESLSLNTRGCLCGSRRELV